MSLEDSVYADSVFVNWRVQDSFQELKNQAGKKMSDKVGDLLIRIKNGYMAHLNAVSSPYSNLSIAILQVLKDEGFIENFEKNERQIKINLKYENKKPVLTDVKRISKPGKRVYSASKQIPRVYNGLGFAIVSTPKGIMTDKKARKENVGGEIMAFVW